MPAGPSAAFIYVLPESGHIKGSVCRCAVLTVCRAAHGVICRLVDGTIGRTAVHGAG